MMVRILVLMAAQFFFGLGLVIFNIVKVSVRQSITNNPCWWNSEPSFIIQT
jgi:hypothetical protein